MIGRWFPANVYIYTTLIAKFATQSGLWVLYPERRYAIPARIRVLTPPSSVELLEEVKVTTSRRYIYAGKPLRERVKGNFGVLEEDDEKVVTRGFRVKLKPDVYMVRVKASGDIHVLPAPRKRPEYVVHIFSVRMFAGGGVQSSVEFNHRPLYVAKEYSNRGAMWREWYVFAVPLSEELVIRYKKVSERGSREEVLRLGNGRVNRVVRARS